MKNQSTYLSTEELSKFKRLAKDNFTDMSKLVKKAIVEFPEDLRIIKVKETSTKEHRSYQLENVLIARLENEKSKTGETKSTILYSLIHRMLKD